MYVKVSVETGNDNEGCSGVAEMVLDVPNYKFAPNIPSDILRLLGVSSYERYAAALAAKPLEKETPVEESKFVYLLKPNDDWKSEGEMEDRMNAYQEAQAKESDGSSKQIVGASYLSGGFGQAMRVGKETEQQLRADAGA